MFNILKLFTSILKIDFNKINKQYLKSILTNIVKTMIQLVSRKKNSDKKIINKGTGGGGAKTNYNGKIFEFKTNNEENLLNIGFVKQYFKSKNYCLTKKYQDKQVTFVLHNNLKIYMKIKYNINLFRFPDEAYVIEFINGKKIVIIIEKKEQNIEGSVETKLWSGPSLKREYEIILGDTFQVYYCFCVNNFFKKKFTSNKTKYNILKTILNENNINILYGDDEDYFKKLKLWLYNLININY